MQLVVGERLRRDHGQSYTTMYYDLTNAYFCGTHATMDRAVEKYARPEDVELLCTRHRQSCLRIRAQQQEQESVLHVSSGAPPGDSTAANIFGDVFCPLLEEWLEATADQAVWYEIPWAPGNYIDCGFTDYADDLARKILHDGPTELLRRQRQMDAALDGALCKEGYAQNARKKVMVPCVLGARQHRGLTDIFRRRDLYPGTTTTIARYLGTLMQFNMCHDAEVTARICTAWRNFKCYG